MAHNSREMKPTNDTESGSLIALTHPSMNTTANDISCNSSDSDDVDIHPSYQVLLHERAEVIAFLFSSRLSDAVQELTKNVAAKYMVTANEAIEELRRLLAIKVFENDQNAEKISPTPLMDELWHAVILDTRLYAELQQELGCVLHHRPGGASEQESDLRKVRLATMKTLYRAFFTTDPLEPIPVVPVNFQLIESSEILDSIKISLISNMETVFLTVKKSTRVSRLMTFAQDRTGVPPAHLRIFFGGARLCSAYDLSHYEIKDGDVLSLLRGQCGC